MQMNASPPLPQRIGRLLRAKQFLVFYAIGLVAIDLGAVLLSGWLYRHRPLHTLLGTETTVVGSAAARPAAALIALALAWLVLTSVLRAGYLRSLLGRAHWRPRDLRQFVTFLEFMALFALLGWGVSAAVNAAQSSAGLAEVAVLGAALATIPFLYADYVIIIDNVGLGRALVRSLQTVRANLFLSLLVLFVPTALAGLVAQLGGAPDGAAGSQLPAMVIYLLVMGCVQFLTDVVLICAYIDTVERGNIPVA